MNRDKQRPTSSARGNEKGENLDHTALEISEIGSPTPLKMSTCPLIDIGYTTNFCYMACRPIHFIRRHNLNFITT